MSHEELHTDDEDGEEADEEYEDKFIIETQSQ